MMLEENPRGLQAVQVSAVFSTVALMILVLRVYTRVFIVRHFGVEDGFAVFGMVCSVGLTISIVIQAMYGMGEHQNEINMDILQDSLKAFYASLVVYNLGLGLIKMSILFQYRRIFPTKRFQIACWIAIVAVSIHTAWAVFGNVFACFPVHAFWIKSVRAECINQFAMWFTNAAINIVTDITIILLPMPVIRSLNLPRHQKQALTAIFAIGGFVCIVSILRLHSLVAISNSPDPTYDNPPAATWSAVELNIGIMCSCLPCLRPLLARCFPRAFSAAAAASKPRGDNESEMSFCSENVLVKRCVQAYNEGEAWKEIMVEEGRDQRRSADGGGWEERRLGRDGVVGVGAQGGGARGR